MILIKKHQVILAAMSLIFMGCAMVGPLPLIKENPTQKLTRQLKDIFDDPRFDNAFWGVKIQSVGSQEAVFSLNEQKGFIPASNMKLYTTAAALVLLGPDFRYQTPLYYKGEIDENGVLNGDIIIKGQGDPSISDRYRKGISTEQMLNEWADALSKQGIKEIQGNIIGDDDYFDDQEIEDTWSNGYLQYWYATGSSALTINDNCYSYVVRPGLHPGDKALLDIIPQTSYLEVTNDIMTTVSTGRRRVDLWRPPMSNEIRFFGSMPEGSRPYEHFASVYNGTVYAVTVFKETLEKQGIKVHGQPLDIDQFSAEEKAQYAQELHLIHIHQSPPLSELIAMVNKPSQNFYADMLLKTLGKEFAGQGGFMSGAREVSRCLRAIGVPSVREFRMSDGSGLSRMNLVQPRQTVALLQYMIQHPYSKAFYDSMAIAGVEGTISGRMKDALTKGNVHAKTGFVSRARALSGYVTSIDGEMFVFSMMCNNYTVPTSLANELQDRACTLLAQFSRR